MQLQPAPHVRDRVAVLDRRLRVALDDEAVEGTFFSGLCGGGILLVGFAEADALFFLGVRSRGLGVARLSGGTKCAWWSAVCLGWCGKSAAREISYQGKSESKGFSPGDSPNGYVICTT